MNENEALAILMANTKRKKRAVDLITVAEACDYLTRLYGSRRAVGQRTGLSEEMVRQFTKLLELPPEVKDLISNRTIDRLDLAYRISKLGGPQIQVEAAHVLARASSKHVRDVVRLVKSGRFTLAQATSEVSKAKPDDVHVFMMDFDDLTYSRLQKAARERNVLPAELVKQVVERWLSNSNQG